MPYARKPRTMRKPYKKRSYTRKPSSKSMYSIAKRVLKSNTETKSRVTSWSPSGILLSHNVPRIISNQLIGTTQGTDGDGFHSNRIGTSIQPVGLKLYIEMAQEQPLADTMMINGNIWIKVWVLRAHHSNINSSNDFLRLISSNTTLAPVQRRTHNVVRQFSINLKNYFEWWNNGSAIDATPEFKTRVLYIPMGNIKKYLYENDTTDDGKYFNYCIHAVAFTAHPAADTNSVLANIKVNSEFFFKDN